MMKIYCYIRVSCDKQDYFRQEKIFKDKGYIDGVNCEYIKETYTGTKLSRPLWDDLINNKIKERDTIMVESLSRLSRGGVIRTLDLVTELINTKKINIHVFKEGFYLNAGEKLDANTNLLLGIFSVLGQFERDLLSERIKEGLAAKRITGTKSGKPIGHPYKETTTFDNFVSTLNYMVKNNVGQNKACMIMGFPDSTFKKTIKKMYEKYETNNYEEILTLILKEDPSIEIKEIKREW